MINGYRFREHMIGIHGPTASVSKRARTYEPSSTSAGSTASVFLSSLSDLPPAIHPADAVDEISSLGQSSNDPRAMQDMLALDTDYNADVAMSGGKGGKEAHQVENDVGEHFADQAEDVLEDGEGSGDFMGWLAVEEEVTRDHDEPAENLGTPEDPTQSPAFLPPVDVRRYIQGSELLGAVGDNDLITEWPEPIPAYLLEPLYDGRHTNPYVEITSLALETAERPALLHRILPLLALCLSATFNVPRRAVETTLKVATSAVRLAERQLFSRLVAALQKDPDVTPALLRRLELLDPSLSPSIAPRTLATALNRLGVDDSIIVHPQCRNEDCFHVFYEFTIPEDVKRLPAVCQRCSTPLWNAQHRPTFLHFGRRTLQAELETVMTVPGVEEAIERRAMRKEQGDREYSAMSLTAGSAGFNKIYREQDDGSAWSSISSGRSTPVGALSLTVNAAIDWANASSNRSAATHSMGPISLTIADLPSPLRASLACTLLVGITPGPKPPRASNLYKLLLPLVLEIRAADEYGLWIKTPRYPQGKLPQYHR